MKQTLPCLGSASSVESTEHWLFHLIVVSGFHSAGSLNSLKNTKAWPIAPAALLKGRMIMSRKSLWIGLMLMLVVGASVSVSVDARHKKKKHDRQRSSAAPPVSLTAETYTVRACE